jgi:HK97 family phage portal protein
MRASIENPNVPLTSANIFGILGSGRTNAAGVPITKDSVIGHPVLFSGLNLISSDVAGLPVFVYRRRGDQRVADKSHPAWDLLRKKVNPFMRSHTFLQTMVGNALLHRGGYARIHRNSAMVPQALEILDPENTYPAVVNGELIYQTIIDGRDAILPARSVFHIRGLGWSGYDGWSVIDKLRDAIGIGLAAQQFGGRFFMNSAQPRVVIKLPGYLSGPEAVERLRESWGNIHAGVENAHKPAILEGGAEIEPFQLSNEDSQFLQLREFDVKMISAILRVPPHMLGDDSRTSHSSLEQESQRYLDQAIDPWLREIETESFDKLLTEEQKRDDTHFVEFQRAALIRTNMVDRAESYEKGILGGWLSPLYVMQRENIPVPDDQREELAKHLRPMNMTAVGDPMPEPVAEPNEPPQRSESKQPSDVLKKATKRLTTRLVSRVAKDAERAASDPSTFLKWIDDGLYDKHANVLARELEPFGDDADGMAQRFLGQIGNSLLEVSGKAQPSQLQEMVSQVVIGQTAELPAVWTSTLLGETT